MEFKDLFVFAIIAGVFIFSVIIFATQFATENELSTNLNDQPYVNKIFGSVETQLNSSSSDTNSSYAALVDEEKHPISTTIGFAFTSILSALNTFASMGLNTVSYVFIFAQEMLGISPIITGAFMAILIGIIVLAIWSVVRAGR